MIRLGLRPNSSGGMRDPLRLPVPLPGGIIDPLLLGTGDTFLLTWIFGASGVLISGVLISGVLISGTFGYWRTKNCFDIPIYCIFQEDLAF